MAWNLHIVGDKSLEDVDAIAAEIVKAVTDAGHTVVSAVLTTDLGTTDVTPAPAADVPAADPAPPADPAPVDPAVPTDTPPVA